LPVTDGVRNQEAIANDGGHHFHSIRKMLDRNVSADGEDVPAACGAEFTRVKASSTVLNTSTSKSRCILFALIAPE
jgi:hypothetical protein